MSEERHIEWVTTGFTSKTTVSSTESNLYIERKVNYFRFIFWILVLMGLAWVVVFLLLQLGPSTARTLVGGSSTILGLSTGLFFLALGVFFSLVGEQPYSYVFDRKKRELHCEKPSFTARSKNVVVHVLGKKSHVRLEQIPLTRGPANFQIKLILENWRELTLPCIPTLKDALECAEMYRQLLGIEHPVSLA